MSERVLSLRTRLVGTMTILFVGGTAALYLAARAYGQAAADRSYDRLLTGSALSIVETLSIIGGKVQVDVPYTALDMLSAAPDDRVFYRVFGPDEKTVTGYDDLPLQEGRERRNKQVAPESARFFNAEYRGELVRFALLGREIAEPGVTGRLWVQVGQTRRAREAMAHELVFNALLPIGTLTFLALALVWFGVARALRPLERIGRELTGREPADLYPVRAPVPAEMKPLIESINGFMHRLDGNMGTLRAFIAEAAHQMRTPLAALRAQAQSALDEDDPAELRRGLLKVDRNAARLSRLLNQLLSDATVIHRSDLRRFESFDLVHTVRKAMREAIPLASDTPVSFDTPLQEAPFMGDALMLGEALKNLIDNALHHGHAECAKVELGLRLEGDDYLLTVSDRGPGIPSENHGYVFERFARGESVAPGAGLGLPIVRQVVESHRGDILLSQRQGGGLVVRLRLPRRRT